MDPSIVIEAFGDYRWCIIPFGLFLGLLGYRMYRISLFFIGFLFGFTVGVWLSEVLEIAQYSLFLGIILGVLVGIVTHFLIRFSLFIAGMTAGVVLASILLPEIPLTFESWETLALTGGIALLAGFITLLLYKTCILLVTSLIGTYLVYAGTKEIFPTETENWAWAMYVALLVVFFLVQAYAVKKHPDPIHRSRTYRKW